MGGRGITVGGRVGTAETGAMPGMIAIPGGASHVAVPYPHAVPSGSWLSLQRRPVAGSDPVLPYDAGHLAHASAHAPDADGPFVGTMEQIETQVSDLRYLSQAPVALSPGGGVGPGGVGVGVPGVSAGAAAASAYDHQSPGSASVGDNSAQSVTASNANKRKSIDDGTSKQTRSKRNRVSFPSCCFDVT